MKATKLLVTPLVAAVLFMGGCISTNPFSSGGSFRSNDISESSTIDSPDSNTFNIPHPNSLKVNQGESFTFSHKGQKCGLTVLTGATDVNVVNNFFQQNLPQNGWSIISDVEYGGSRVTNWRQGDFVLTVIVRDAPILGLKSQTRVELWKAPKR